ncbi:MAG: hypothetical protein SGJ13_02695, partial [Actinomycetota bacterium]|nr:hypothetical protein [Actinomycetota bacterium]
MRADGPPRSVRVGVGIFLGVVALFGFTGFEAWPLTSFRLFSVARDDTRTSWEARTVDAAGVETPLGQHELSLGYRLTEWPLSEFPSSSDATREDVCRGIARGARDAGREVVGVRVYRVRERVERVDGEWVVDQTPELYHDCATEPHESGERSAGPVARAVPYGRSRAGGRSRMSQ